MKLFKELFEFFIICYLSCLITKIALNKLTFDSIYLIDSLFITLGAEFGWFVCRYFQNRKKQNM